MIGEMRQLRWTIAAVLAALVTALGGLWAAAPASPSTPIAGYDASAYVYDAPAQLLSPDTAATNARGSPSGPDVASWGRSGSTRGCCTAADAARTLDIGGGHFPNTAIRSVVRTPEEAVSVNPEIAHGPSVVARSQQLPFADSVFDRVTMNHFPSDQFGGGTLSEVARVTKPGGALSLTTGVRADVGGIVSELNGLGYSTTVGQAEGGIPWITGVLGQ